jgi:NAD(P)H dehydrogenase (quinone)
MVAPQIGVTGATGGLGGRVAARLADRGIPQRLLVRDAARAPDLPEAEVATFGGYDDPEGLRRALDGIDTLLLVSAAEDRDRVALHRGAVDAAVAAGVERIVYTSFSGAAADCTFTFGRDHFHTEQHIRATGVGFTFLRDNLYIDFVPLLCGPDGVIRGPAGDGRVAAVARDDIAEVAAVVLAGRDHEGGSYDLTGPEAFSLAEAAEELSRASGRLVTYEEETVEEAYASRRPSGAPEFELDGWISTYTAIAAGELEATSDCVARFLDRDPISLGDWLRANRESYRHLVQES